MYGINNEANYSPENFIAGDYPIKKDFGTIKNGATIRRHAPIVVGDNGIEEATAETLDKLIGIAADKPSGKEVVFYLTGEFFSEGLCLPNGVTVEALKPTFRKLGIFMKELNGNG
jgi:hypothetical protein